MKCIESHTATDFQEILAKEPKEVMRSQDQEVAAAEDMSTKGGASCHIATRRQLRDRLGKGECGLAVNHTNTT